MNTLQYKGKTYPHLQAEGNASQFAIPFAKHFCKGDGFDIGCNRKEWAFPDAQPIDLLFDDEWEAYKLPRQVDYIYSSHCLEHLPDWVEALDYWTSMLKSPSSEIRDEKIVLYPGGTLFLYLPHYNQEYWRPWNNRKHLHVFTPEIINDYMVDRGYKNIFRSERDLNDSFMIVGEKS
jgi:predicted SAM-dependent methyltransferase